jgi:hypothetical protein
VHELVSELFSAATRVLNGMMKQLISVLAVIMLRYVVFQAVMYIVDSMMWRVGKEVELKIQ